jgi:hypothetical protein
MWGADDVKVIVLDCIVMVWEVGVVEIIYFILDSGFMIEGCSGGRCIVDVCEKVSYVAFAGGMEG